MKIELLTHCPEKIPDLAKLWHELLGQIWVPDITIETAELKFKSHLNETKLPLTLVAFEDDKPIGMCSLRENDGIREDLKPWLGSLVVSKVHQKRGVAQLLMNGISKKAKELGFDDLYLFTFDPTLPTYYQRHGWEEIGKDLFRNHAVTVMRLSL